MLFVRTSLLALCVLLLTSCTAVVGPAPASTSPVPSSAPSTDTGSTARTKLATLAVKGRAPMTGYARARFGRAWTDNTDDPLGHNGCDTRIIRTSWEAFAREGPRNWSIWAINGRHRFEATSSGGTS